LGFFIGAALLVLVGFKMALGVLAIFLLCVLIALLTLAKSPLGNKANNKARIGDVFSVGKSVNRLSATRLFYLPPETPGLWLLFRFFSILL